MSRIAATSPPKYEFDFRQGGVAHHGSSRTSVQLKTREGELAYSNGFYIGDETIAHSFGRFLNPLYADWIEVALAAYYLDRLSPRHDRSSPHQWSREMVLKIPVRVLDVWSRPEVSTAIRKTLGFFTEDIWDIEFSSWIEPERTTVQPYLFSTPVSPPVYVALLSGGLDSFAGACQAVADRSANTFVFVSGITNSRQKAAQREQVNALRRLSAKEIYHITVPFGLSRRGRARGEKEEQSQRTRGFLFLTLGAVTSLTAGASTLHVHENGVGAINLPYDASQLGTSNSRGVHPLALLRMEELTRCLINKPFEFVNPHLYETKGQMCRHAAVQRLADYLKGSFSCDGFPVQEHGKPQCGSCTSCLLRRVSLEAAGLASFDPGDQYVCDLSSSITKPAGKQLRALRAMEWQFYKISQRLESPAPWQGLSADFSDLHTLAAALGPRTPGGQAEVCRRLSKLYSNYVSDWNEFSARSHLQAATRAA
jgi:7-cyano-7-deazaguanine synthase in queuosine biosynthesis